MGCAETAASASFACRATSQIADAADCRGDPLSVARWAATAASRELTGREASPSAGVIDSQSVKTTPIRRTLRLRCGQEGQRPQAPNLTTARAIWSTLSSIPPTSMTVTRHRCCCKRSSTASHGCVMFLHGGYTGNKLNDALRKIGTWTIAIIERSDTAKGFVVLPRRRVVERTLAWLSHNRRLAKDFDQTIVPATAWLFVSSIQLFSRRIARL